MPPPKIARISSVSEVSCQLIQKSTPSATTAVMHAADKLDQPGADQIPDAFGIGHDARDRARRSAWNRRRRPAGASREPATRFRMSVIARCAATLITWVSVKLVTACTSVAPATASAIHLSRSGRCCPMTVSIRNFVLEGSTKAAALFTSTRRRPSATFHRCDQNELARFLPRVAHVDLLLLRARRGRAGHGRRGHFAERCFSTDATNRARVFFAFSLFVATHSAFCRNGRPVSSRSCFSHGSDLA